MHEVVYRENCFEGLTNKKINIGVGPLLISDGSPYKISIVGVSPIDIHWRVVH